MNGNRIIILWILLASYIYALGWIPQLAYIGLVTPAILVHIVINKPPSRSEPHTPEVPREPTPPTRFMDLETVVVDEEFEETIELDCGGEVHLEGWREREIPAEQVHPPDEMRVSYQQQGYERTKVKR